MTGRRYSQQRELIYDAVHGSVAHPSAEMVYQQLKPLMPKLSLGTVYRNLHQLSEEGRLTEIRGPVSRFDANTLPHAHFLCRGCGSVSDVDMTYDSRLDREAESGGWAVQSHDVLFYGICPSCLGENNTQTTTES